MFVYDLDTAKRLPITPEGFELRGPVSPDGKFVVVSGPDKKVAVVPVRDGEPRDIPGLNADSFATAWSADGQSLYMNGPPPVPGRIWRVDRTTGQKTLWKELIPTDRAGLSDVFGLVTLDGKSYVYSYSRHLLDLYLAEGLR